MTHPAVRTAVAALALTAGAFALAVIAAAPASATLSPATAHCSTWKQAGTTKYYVRECAQTITYTSGKHVKETAYLKNTGRQNLKVDGYLAASWNQAGTGTPFTGVTVAPGHSTAITRAFKVSRGPYTATSSITVAGHTATVHSSFTK